MNKKVFIIILIIVSIPFMGAIYMKYNYDSNLLNSVKKVLPKSFKNFLKKNIFYKNELERQLETQKISYQKLEKAYDNAMYNLIELQQKQNLVNSQNLPYTQLLQLDIKVINLNIAKTKPNDPVDNYRHSKKVNSFYLESDDENIYIFLKNGDIFYLNISDINQEQIEYNFKNIKNNLPDYINVKDTLLENDQLYMVFQTLKRLPENENFKCDFKYRLLNFDDFFL